MKLCSVPIPLRGLVGAWLVVWAVAAHAQQAGFHEPLVPRLPPPADPLEPWSLEAVPPKQAGVAVVAPQPPVLPGDIPVEPLTPVLTQPDTATLVPGTAIPIVRCRYVIVSSPLEARQLEALLHAGVSFEEARNTLALTDIVDTTRDYALEDLQPEVLGEIRALPDSAWSHALTWRGRPLLVQLLGRESRPRSTLPALGEGLGPEEQQRLAQFKSRLRPANTAALQRDLAQKDSDQDAGVKVATVVEQVAPEYPIGATTDGSVTLMVEVGRLNEVFNVQVESASDEIFVPPAIEAARASKYQAAMRNGIAEAGTVRLTYRFAAPLDPNALPGVDNPQAKDPDAEP